MSPLGRKLAWGDLAGAADQLARRLPCPGGSFLLLW
jgi:hypothetical protein